MDIEDIEEWAIEEGFAHYDCLGNLTEGPPGPIVYWLLRRNHREAVGLRRRT